jgi:nucleoside-diphosphate-sugar epimerase
LGLAAAGRFREAGWSVTGLTASGASAAALGGVGFPVFAADIADPAALRRWAGAFDVAVHCASSGRGGEDAYRRVFLEGSRNLAAVIRPSRLIFVGSTSVYAQTDGGWVDESSPAEPERETGRLLLEAEREVLGAGGVVLRCAGLYGPGRWALLAKFLDGTARIEEGGGRWINQIHRDDAAAAMVLAASGIPAGIYNVADDCPVRQSEVFGEFSRRFGRPLPPEGPADRSRKRGWTNKRVANAKLKAAGWACRYPDFRRALDEGVMP